MQPLLFINLKDQFSGYENKIYRLVEGQSFVSTRKLVNSFQEHEILESLLDASKPPVKTRNQRGELHYLLYTPFRYPPLKTGGRFHTRLEQSIFYGAEDLSTAMAEVAYGRFVFMKHSLAKFEPMQVPYTHFMAKVKSDKALLLTASPFNAHKNAISHPSFYTASQALGKAMRETGAELFTYYSARKINGINVGLLSMEAFENNNPVGKQGHWQIFIDENVIEYKNDTQTHVFKHTDFIVNGAFAYEY